MSRYKNWQDYLGFFLTGSGAGYAGAYDHANELGLARVFPRDRVRGVKLFGFGPQFEGRDLFSDDGSDYVELWGGLPLTFYNYQDWPFAPGEVREWDEYWIPFAQTGGLSAAARSAILYVATDAAHRTTLAAAATTQATRGTLVLSRESSEVKRWDVVLDPGKVFRAQVDAPSLGMPNGPVRLRLYAPDGTLLGEATDNGQ